MNPIELRYEIYKFLVGLCQPAGVDVALLEAPAPGESPVIKVATNDPYRPGATRYYRVVIEEREEP